MAFSVNYTIKSIINLERSVMKKIIMSLSLSLVFFTFPISDIYANECEQQADYCYNRCDSNWDGDTVFDGAGRTACKTGCAVAEAGCVIASWL